MSSALWSPYGFHGISNGFQLQIHVLFHKDSMEHSTWNSPSGFHGILCESTLKCVVKNNVNIKNQTLAYMMCHMWKQGSILTATLSDPYKIANWHCLILLCGLVTQIKCQHLPTFDLGVNNNIQPYSSTTITIHDTHPLPPHCHPHQWPWWLTHKPGEPPCPFPPPSRLLNTGTGHVPSNAQVSTCIPSPPLHFLTPTAGWHDDNTGWPGPCHNMTMAQDDHDNIMTTQVNDNNHDVTTPQQWHNHPCTTMIQWATSYDHDHNTKTTTTMTQQWHDHPTSSYHCVSNTQGKCQHSNFIEANKIYDMKWCGKWYDSYFFHSQLYLSLLA